MPKEAQVTRAGANFVHAHLIMGSRLYEAVLKEAIKGNTPLSDYISKAVQEHLARQAEAETGK